MKRRITSSLSARWQTACFLQMAAHRQRGAGLPGVQANAELGSVVGRVVTSLTERGGANLEHRYVLNYAEQRPTELNCTAVTGEFSISAGHAAMRTSLGVKGSQVQILSSRRRDRVVSPTEAPPDLLADLGKRLL